MLNKGFYDHKFVNDMFSTFQNIKVYFIIASNLQTLFKWMQIHFDAFVE